MNCEVLGRAASGGGNDNTASVCLLRPFAMVDMAVRCVYAHNTKKAFAVIPRFSRLFPAGRVGGKSGNQGGGGEPEKACMALSPLCSHHGSVYTVSLFFRCFYHFPEMGKWNKTEKREKGKKNREQTNNNIPGSGFCCYPLPGRCQIKPRSKPANPSPTSSVQDLIGVTFHS